MTSFASENTYQTLDNATTDDESATLLTAPDLPEVEDVAVNVLVVNEPPIDLGEPLDVDEPPIDLGELLDVDDPPIDLGMDGPRTVLGDGNAISTFLQRLDEKWTTILTTYNADLDAKHAFDVDQRRYDEEHRDAQRRRDGEEQRLMNAELRTMKRMDLEAFLTSSKDAFATEMTAF
jgi:hypothetical protein